MSFHNTLSEEELSTITSRCLISRRIFGLVTNQCVDVLEFSELLARLERQLLLKEECPKLRRTNKNMLIALNMKNGKKSMQREIKMTIMSTMIQIQKDGLNICLLLKVKIHVLSSMLQTSHDGTKMRVPSKPNASTSSSLSTNQMKLYRLPSTSWPIA